jgi:uncharacterized glyoxalase superfamily protein PhnB
MDYQEYKDKYFVKPQPEPKFDYVGLNGIALFFKDYPAALEYYTQVLGPPVYVEGEFTTGWRIGNSWLTLFPSKDGSPKNVEVSFVMNTPAEAERLQRAFIEAGGTGTDPSNELMYAPVCMCPVTDPFGTQIIVICWLDGEFSKYRLDV